MLSQAKSVPGRLIASMTAVNESAPAEAEDWQPSDRVTVRGRSAPTQLAIPH